MSNKDADTWRYRRGRFERTEPRIVSRLGHPLWDADLNSINVLKRFKSAKELRWGMVLRILGPGWQPLEEIRIEGLDWRLSFFPPRTIRVPIVRGPLGRSKPRLTSFKQPVALLQIATEKADLNRARDYGARLLRSLVGLLQTEYNLIVASQPAALGGRNRHQQGRSTGVHGLRAGGGCPGPHAGETPSERLGTRALPARCFTGAPGRQPAVVWPRLGIPQ